MNIQSVSVIMPVKNGLPYLTKTIASIVSQSFKNWELIIVDDHSVDETWRWIELNTKDSRIKYLKNKGSGIIDALETAWIQCEGAFITRMDADDIMPVNKLEKMVEAIQKETRPAVVTGLVKYFKDDAPVNDGYKQYEQWLNTNLLSENPYHQIFKECVIPSPAWMVKREIIVQLGSFKTLEYPEDYDLVFRFMQLGLKIITIPSVIHLWRDHNDRASRNDVHYAENTFLPLKLKWLTRLFSNTNFNLIGAGKKGKKIAQYFIDNQIDFEWFTNNPNKLVVPIYDKCLVELSFNKPGCWIIAVANKEEQQAIIHSLAQQNLNEGVDYLLFC
jgi:glycosyltransferase involved in cell wall biosynthesis